MNEEHASALALIKELYVLCGTECTEITAGDIQVKLQRAPVYPTFDTATSEEFTALRAEVEALRVFKAQAEGAY